MGQGTWTWERRCQKERQRGSWGERLIEVAAWGAEAPWLPCFMRGGRCGLLEETQGRPPSRGMGV